MHVRLEGCSVSVTGLCKLRSYFRHGFQRSPDWNFYTLQSGSELHRLHYMLFPLIFSDTIWYGNVGWVAGIRTSKFLCEMQILVRVQDFVLPYLQFLVLWLVYLVFHFLTFKCRFSKEDKNHYTAEQGQRISCQAFNSTQRKCQAFFIVNPFYAGTLMPVVIFHVKLESPISLMAQYFDFLPLSCWI